MHRTESESHRLPQPLLLTGAFALPVLALLLLIHLYRPSQTGLWFMTLFDTLHAPVFGIIALCLYGVSGMKNGWTPYRRLAFSLLLSFFLAALSELAQYPTARDASFHDLLTDCLGATGFLLLAFACNAFSRVPPWTRKGMALAGGAALLLALMPLLTVSAAYLERNARLPTLHDPGAFLGEVFRRRQNATLEREDFSPELSKSIKVRLGKGPWPGVIFHDIWPDWSAYTTLAIELGNPATEPLQLHLRVQDLDHRRHDQPYSDRFNTSIPLPQGVKVVRIPLADIRNAPATRELNLQSIDGMALFLSAGNAGRVFYVGEIRLE